MPDDSSPVDDTAPRVAQRAEEQFDDTLDRLCKYLKIPAISCEAEHRPDVEQLAERIVKDLSELGFSARVHHLENALPLVSAERCPKQGAPTVLIYGHLDLQPVRGEAWSSPPHEPTRRGERLYARGAADDMAGWVSHLAAVRAWLEVAGELPMNVKFVIEGEEEIGSPNLERYMDALPEVFEADMMVLTDCENPSVDIPGLTVSLRGLYELEITCEGLEQDVHSGLWGNVVPDSGNALVLLLARLLDQDGRLDLGRQPSDPTFREHAAALPLDDEVIRRGARVREDVAPLPGRERPATEWMWRQPAVTILSSTLPAPGHEKNAVRGSASAVLSFRLAPGQTKEELDREIRRRLEVDPPAGVKVTLRERSGGAESFLYQPKGRAFEAADRAYQKAWGHGLVHVGVGGSIPFVAMFGRRFSHLPLILNGVMDPETGAHGPNESLHLGVFRRAILANVYLLDEVSRLSPAQLGS